MKKTITGAETNVKLWNVLTEQEQVKEVLKASQERPQLVYKHSHTCSICHVAKEEIDKEVDAIKKKADIHFVNVIKSRRVSDKLAEVLDVRHESPQVLIVDKGECVWHKSHWGIKAGAILQALGN